MPLESSNRRKTHTVRPAATVRWAVLFVVAVSTVGCANKAQTTGPDPSIALAPDGSEVVEGVPVGMNGLGVGDCYNEPDEVADQNAGELSEVLLVPCQQGHDSEVYYVANLPSGEYPGEEQVQASVVDHCIEQFADFAGIAYDQSRLDITYYYPDSVAWRADDRGYVCSVYDINGNSLQGSMANSGY